MAFTGTQGIETKIQRLSTDVLSFKENSVPINLNVDINDTTTSKIAFLEEKMALLEQKLEEQKSFTNILTGTILPYAKNAIDFVSNTLLPPPNGYEWCFGQIVSKTDEKYSTLYSVIEDYWNTSDSLTDDQFQLPDLRNCFLRGCPEYIENSEENRLVGNFQASGVPNITGSFYSDCIMYDYLVETEGAFLHEIIEQYWLSAGNSGNAMRKFSFNANLVSQVYKDGLTEVRPDNKAVNYIIKL